jgi:hypothetical protein
MQLVQKIRDEVISKYVSAFPGYTTKLRSIKINVTDKLRPNAKSTIKNGDCSIDYYVGNTLIVYLYSRYAAIMNYLPQMHNEECFSYINYIAYIVKNEPLDTTIDDFLKKIKYPDTFCGLSSEDSSSIDRRARAIFAETVLPVTGLTLGHEVAHHLLGHLPPPDGLSAEQSRRIEAEADRAGSQIYGTTSARAPAAIIHAVLTQLRAHPFSAADRHDAPECRFILYLREDQVRLGEEAAEKALSKLKDRVDFAEFLPQALEVIRQGENGSSTRCESFHFDRDEEERQKLASEKAIRENNSISSVETMCSAILGHTLPNASQFVYPLFPRAQLTENATAETCKRIARGESVSFGVRPDGSFGPVIEKPKPPQETPIRQTKECKSRNDAFEAIARTFMQSWNNALRTGHADDVCNLDVERRQKVVPMMKRLLNDCMGAGEYRTYILNTSEHPSDEYATFLASAHCETRGGSRR